MARLAPLDDAVPRVGAFLTSACVHGRKAGVKTRNISTGIGYLLCDLIDRHGSERREGPGE